MVSKEKLPEIARDYIELVKPLPVPEPHPPFMQGWIVGCEDVISLKVQVEIENKHYPSPHVIENSNSTHRLLKTGGGLS